MEAPLQVIEYRAATQFFLSLTDGWSNGEGESVPQNLLEMFCAHLFVTLGVLDFFG
jgi:hypothetical protein